MIATPDDAQALAESRNGAQRPAMIVPAHGGGRIYRGGVVGHRGGSGRPADRVRRALLSVGRTGIAKVLKPLIDGQPVSVIDRNGTVVAIDPNPADRLRAVEIALKYGLGTANRGNVEVATAVETESPPYMLLPKLGTEWTDADQATLNKLQCTAPA